MNHTVCRPHAKCPFRYDLNQNTYDYIVGVTNRFKWLDLLEAWRTMDRGSWHCTGGRNQDQTQVKEMQKGRMVVWGDLTNSCEYKRSERQRRKGKISWFECRVPKDSKERWESLLQWSMQRNQFSSVQSLSRVQLFAIPWIAVRQAFLSITNSQSPCNPMSIESVMPSRHLLSPSPPDLNLSQHQGLFQWVS